MFLLANEVWTYWLSIPLLAVAVLIALGLGVLYLVKVAGPYYSQRAQYRVDEAARQRLQEYRRQQSAAPDSKNSLAA
ncbi:MAG: hypothetical protein ACRDZ8_09125 [Acidimicrobiales bacterium]